MNYFFSKYITEGDLEGRWNVVQVINEQARYFVLKGELNSPTPLPFLAHGWIEDEEWFTDGEDFINLTDWEKHEGVLLNF